MKPVELSGVGLVLAIGEVERDRMFVGPPPPKHVIEGWETLKDMAVENRGDVIETYLAAADACKTLSDHKNNPDIPWRGKYEKLAAGKFTTGDVVANFIINWMSDYFAKKPARTRSKSLRRATGE